MAAALNDPRLVVKVFLYGIEPEIWRRFSIPAAADFAALHRAIQDAMGWDDAHLHEFRHGKGKRLVDVIGPAELGDTVPPGGSFQDETQLTIAGFAGRRALPIRLLYRYDFGDEWLHEVVIEERTTGKPGKPELLGGARACPPEDCGGAWQYNQILAGECDWWDEPDWDPEKFAPKKVKFR
jgi:hypothetical protein